MFVAYWTSGLDPFDDVEVARAFAEDHPALEFISSQWMEWVSRNVGENTGSGEIFIDAPETGVLGYLGYRVGKTKGLAVADRRKFLLRSLPAVCLTLTRANIWTVGESLSPWNA
jgi:hypothetical protein